MRILSQDRPGDLRPVGQPAIQQSSERLPMPAGDRSRQTKRGRASTAPAASRLRLLEVVARRVAVSGAVQVVLGPPSASTQHLERDHRDHRQRSKQSSEGMPWTIGLRRTPKRPHAEKVRLGGRSAAPPAVSRRREVEEADGTAISVHAGWVAMPHRGAGVYPQTYPRVYPETYQFARCTWSGHLSRTRGGQRVVEAVTLGSLGRGASGQRSACRHHFTVG